METSEDDAGAPTNASRRVSAREKDVVKIEDVNATNIVPQDSSEPKASCGTIAMSEDHFDGESVPSPSTQDVNTSTEAILDMIDEIVDGPGASKRSNVPLDEKNDSESTENQPPPVIESVSKIDSPHSLTASCSTSVPVPEVQETDSSASELSVPQNKVLENVKVDLIETQASSLELETSETEKSCHPEPVASCSKESTSVSDTPSTSELQSKTQDTLEKECEPSERTVQSVVLSDSKDKIVVESAVSTSSDNSSEARDCSVSVSTRSPLRRRLVRPVPSRPDSTVSSSVDSSVNTDISTSEYVAKDVSSSSDIVPSLYESKPEEIRNISEVSTCKAETSVSLSKKIRLVRQKITPQVSQVDDAVDTRLNDNSEQCQSSSSSPISQCESPHLSNTPLLDSSTSADNAKCQVASDSVVSELSTNAREEERHTIQEDTQNRQEVRDVKDQVVETPTKHEEDSRKVPPIKLNLSTTLTPSNINEEKESCSSETSNNEFETPKQVPKLTIKIGGKQPENVKSPGPKLTIKPIKPPESNSEKDDIEQVSSVTKINIKPIQKPAEKINEAHRTSSSSEISESEYSENDESTSASDHASTSDQGSSNVVPKVTIKLGKPGTETEGQFFMQKNIPKLTIKTIQSSENEAPLSPSKLKVIISQSEETEPEKVPKLTIKTVTKCENQPLSPKLTIKPVRPTDHIKESPVNQDALSETSRIKSISDSSTSSDDIKDNLHVPKITIKPITKPDVDLNSKSKKLQDNTDIPVITKLNIKPIIKPTDSIENVENLDEKVPVVSKLNIKPLIKPKDSEIDSKDDIPKITKLNIKPIKSPIMNSCEETICDDKDDSIPVITKINIKPIVKPIDEGTVSNNENHPSESGDSTDEDPKQIPVVTKLNIKPICKPENIDDSNTSSASKEENIPIVTKLNIKPLIKPEDNTAPVSPKKDNYHRSSPIPVVTKLNIKPIVKPDEKPKVNDESCETSGKNPPLVMKINRKAVDTYVTENQCNMNKNDHDHCNNVDERSNTPTKLNAKPSTKLQTPLHSEQNKEKEEKIEHLLNCIQNPSSSSTPVVNKSCTNQTEGCQSEPGESKANCVSNCGIAKHPEQCNAEDSTSEVVKRTNLDINTNSDSINIKSDVIVDARDGTKTNYVNDSQSDSTIDIQKTKTLPVKQNCTLLKKLLEIKPENSKDSDTEDRKGNVKIGPKLNADIQQSAKNYVSEQKLNMKCEFNLDINHDNTEKTTIKHNSPSDMKPKGHSFQDVNNEINENLTKPLEINISDKPSHHSSDQDSPRIILKINKTDHGASAKIITDDIKKSELQHLSPEHPQEISNDVHQNKNLSNSKKKVHVDTPMPVGKILRSSRIVQGSERGSLTKQILNKRSSTALSPKRTLQQKEDLSLLETKRLKLGQLLSNKSMSLSPLSPNASSLSPPSKALEIKEEVKLVNHSLLNNENCAKNGSSKLHNILSNLQAKQLHIPLNDINHRENNDSPDLKSSTSMGSIELETENSSTEKIRPEIQEMIFQENSESRDFNIPSEELSQDPLEVETHLKGPNEYKDIPKTVEMTPQPKKRGRPRKIPLSEGAKPVVSLPVPALEERPQRSLRLSRERPIVLVKPRGRGRGRGRRVNTENSPLESDLISENASNYFESKSDEEIDPTSSRIKLPRMTEALDKMPCSTPISSRRRGSSSSDMYENSQDYKDGLDTSLPKMENPFLKSPDMLGEGRGRGFSRGRGRGSRGGRVGRTPRGRGRGRGGGRGAMYMKETMGIYGRVCGPATTTVQLFEEETCMMDDNATPSKPSHLLDEDSQSSVKSSTNESSKMKKSKFADLFDSNKVWTAADVKEYLWPPADVPCEDAQIMMIQEQVAMFLGVKSFKRRYPELKRRTITGDEKNYVLSKGLVTEALCDLGITAVDASEVLDIMLSDYPHKYEEYRSHQRERQLNEPEEEDVKSEVKVDRVEMKSDLKTADTKPDQPKIDPEKLRLEMAAAAVASASEWNARMNAARRGACADLQSLTVLRRRAPPGPAPQPRVRPPAGFYPHALLPGQHQHSYRTYTSEELRYFPLNTVLAAPPAPPSPVESSSDSEPDWGSRYSTTDDSDTDTHRNAKRKRLTKTKRNSQSEAGASVPAAEEVVDTCRTCKLRLEANRKYTHERFLVCSNCNAKLHASCVDLGPDTIRKAREYPWQCAECKTCGVCSRVADDDKMLFCDLCDRGFHIYCVGLTAVPNGRWHCVECAICKSCGARTPGGLTGEPVADGAPEPHWHHQTRRGPGGHKVYSHSLCTPCASKTKRGYNKKRIRSPITDEGYVAKDTDKKAYRIGRYCPLCERSFIGPKGTMQLVICKLCDRQLHQECVRQTVSQLKVLDYTCGDCRRGGITSRAAAVRLAPRTIATLFMAKRRFNKYAHRQYLQSRLAQAAADERADVSDDDDTEH